MIHMNKAHNEIRFTSSQQPVEKNRIKKILIFIPTYNEHDNIDTMVNQLLDLQLGLDLLFVDDNSPDGTGKLLEALALKNENVFVEHRSSKLGIGSAHIYGINWAFDKGYDYLITMDCDFTHSPDYINQFLAQAQTADIVVGSRYLQQGSLSTWNRWRKALTHLGHWATSVLLNMPYDATGSYRLYRLDVLPRTFLGLIHSKGYSFFFESLFLLHQNGYRVKEISTHLPARTYGHSKMKLSDMVDSVKRLVRLFAWKCFSPKKFHIPVKSTKLSIDLNPNLDDPQHWNQYWTRQSAKQVHVIYNKIASFYRNFIILPSLNRCIDQNVSRNSLLLHAGCGGGQVDRNVCTQQNVLALDISDAALEMYAEENSQVKSLIHGSIFAIPLEDESLDGVYNLGVMEHFSEDEIEQILMEFNRVLKPGGKVMLFWPPRFGLSVIVLRVVHYLLNNMLKRNVQLHPEEITHIRSKHHAYNILNRSNFRLVQYNFNIRDVFTHAIIVGIK